MLLLWHRWWWCWWRGRDGLGSGLALACGRLGLAALLLLDLARLVVLDELVAPDVEEELRVGVELHAVLAVAAVRVEEVESGRRVGLLVHEAYGLGHRASAHHLLVEARGDLELLLAALVLVLVVAVGQRHLLVLDVELGALDAERVNALMEHATPRAHLHHVLGYVVEYLAGVLTQRAQLADDVRQRQIRQALELVGLARRQRTLRHPRRLDDVLGERHDCSKKRPQTSVCLSVK